MRLNANSAKKYEIHALWHVFLNDLLQLVDLKAELYRKQEQFKKDKLGQDSAYTGLKSKIKEKV